MKRIVFEDYEDEQTTPLNAENLNKLQDNIEEAIDNVEFDTSVLEDLETKDTEQDTRMTSIEAKDTEQDGRLDNLEDNVEGLEDTGWVNLTWASNFTGYSEGEVPIIRKKNGIVQLHGIGKTTTTLSGDSTGKIMFIIPEEFRPTKVLSVVQHGSSRAKWLFAVNTNGNCTASRYTADGSAWNDITPSLWLPFSATYIV